jgi:hypothetical protein
VNDDAVKKAADAMVRTGMKALAAYVSQGSPRRPRGSVTITLKP